MSVVRTFLDLSTAHLPKELGSFSEPENVTTWQTHTIYNHSEYGFFIHVPDDDTYLDPGDVPDELRVIFDYARSLGCDYVLFDRDAAIDTALPTWEW